jgi:hypothetical protein
MIRAGLRRALWVGIALAFCPVHSARADSVFSIAGLGEWVYPSDARGRGMGGLGIAVADKRNLSLMNPAAAGFIEQPSLYFSMSPESRRVKDGERTFRDNSPDFPLLRGVVIVPGGVRLSAALHQWNHTNFDLLGNGPPDTLFGSVRRVEGRGGFTALSLAAAVRPVAWLSLGVESDWPFGSYRETWRRDFPDSLPLLDTVDELRGTSSSEPSWTAGVLATYGGVSGGAYIRPARDLTLDERVTTVMKHVTSSERTVRLPMETGFGVTVEPRPGLRAGAEMVFAGWADFEMDGEPAAGYRDVTRFGAGLEWVRDPSPHGRFLDRVPLRVGYFQQPWHFRDAEGNSIDERFFSLGLGMPFSRDNGMLDAAVEFGRRGDLARNGLEESVVRFTVGISYSRMDMREFPQ